MPSRVLSFVTPLQKFQDFFPHSRLDAHFPLRVFGSTMFVHTHALKQNKLDPRSLKWVFLATLPHKRATNVMTQFHKSYMLA